MKKRLNSLKWLKKYRFQNVFRRFDSSSLRLPAGKFIKALIVMASACFIGLNAAYAIENVGNDSESELVFGVYENQDKQQVQARY